MTPFTDDDSEAPGRDFVVAPPGSRDEWAKAVAWLTHTWHLHNQGINEHYALFGVEQDPLYRATKQANRDMHGVPRTDSSGRLSPGPGPGVNPHQQQQPLGGGGDGRGGSGAGGGGAGGGAGAIAGLDSQPGAAIRRGPPTRGYAHPTSLVQTCCRKSLTCNAPAPQQRRRRLVPR